MLQTRTEKPVTTMNQFTTRTDGEETLDELHSNLSNGDRRWILGLLSERAPETVTVRDIAVRLSEDPCQGPDSVRQARIRLEHSHLPALDAASLVEWDRACNLVRSTSQDLLREACLVEVITGQRFQSERLDSLFDALADRRRRAVVDVMAPQDDPVALEALVHRLRAKENDSGRQSSPNVDTLRTSLHHVHLPKLAAAGLVTYEAETLTVDYEGHPLLDSGPSSSGLTSPGN